MVNTFNVLESFGGFWSFSDFRLLVVVFDWFLIAVILVSLILFTMAGIDFVVLIGYGSLMMFISQLINILRYMQLQNAEINWYRYWKRETNRQRTEQL